MIKLSIHLYEKTVLENPDLSIMDILMMIQELTKTTEDQMKVFINNNPALLSSFTEECKQLKVLKKQHNISSTLSLDNMF